MLCKEMTVGIKKPDNNTHPASFMKAVLDKYQNLIHDKGLKANAH